MKKCIICKKEQESLMCKACVMDAGHKAGKGLKTMCKATAMAIPVVINVAIKKRK